jgi:hypothetical protein
LPGAEGFWLKVAPESERLLDQSVLAILSKDFNDLKHKIILCEGQLLNSLIEWRPLHREHHSGSRAEAVSKQLSFRFD